MYRPLALGSLFGSIAIIAAGVLLRPSGSVLQPQTATPSASTPRRVVTAVPGAYETASQGVYGHFVQAANGTITVDSGPLGTYVLGTDERTTVERGVGHVWRIDRDFSRLQPSDEVWVAASTDPSGHLVAHVISANSFVSRDGIVSATDPGYMDVRVRLDRYSKDLAETPTRFWLDPNALVRQQPSLSPVFPSDITVGQHIALQGFIADDGDFVVLYLEPEAY